MFKTIAALPAVLITAGLAAGCGGSRHELPPTPSLYTDYNSAAVWQHPEQHRGARVDIRGTIGHLSRIRQGFIVSMHVPGVPGTIGAHVFDRRFHARPGAALHIVGTVRGPLGSSDVPYVPLVPSLAPGAAVVDAQAASLN